jgi:hypothetical protein
MFLQGENGSHCDVTRSPLCFRDFLHDEYL